MDHCISLSLPSMVYIYPNEDHGGGQRSTHFGLLSLNSYIHTKLLHETIWFHSLPLQRNKFIKYLLILINNFDQKSSLFLMFWIYRLPKGQIFSGLVIFLLISWDTALFSEWYVLKHNKSNKETWNIVLSLFIYCVFI